MMGKAAAALAATVAAFALLASNAMALGVTASGSITNKQAGAHSDVAMTVQFTGVDATTTGHAGDPSTAAKNLTLHLPAGLLGDPTGPTLCTAAQFATDTAGGADSGCPASSQVGTVVVDAILDTTATPASPSGLALSGLNAKMFLIEPKGGEPARLGIWVPTLLGDPLHIESPIQVRSSSDYGLDSVLVDLPRQVFGNAPCDDADGCNLFTTKMAITLWGDTAAHPSLTKPFMVNPTECGPQTLKVDASSYGAPNDIVSASADLGTTTGCASVPFGPGIGATSPLKADQPNGFDVAIAYPGSITDATVQSHIKKAVVTLPEGITMSPAVASDGLDGCSDDQFGVGKDVDPTCPELSQLGTVKMVSPLVGALTGKVYLGNPQPGKQFRLLGFARKGDVRVKLVGAANPDPSTGQLTTVFDDLPRQPFSEFVLSFRGGPTAVLQASATCGDSKVKAVFTPYSGQDAITSEATVTTEDCGSNAFAPTVAAQPNTWAPAVDSHLSLTFDRPDGQARLAGLSMTLPPGQLGNLFAFPSCPYEVAKAAACSDASRVGTATVASGTGSKPFTVQGTIYLVAPYDGGVGGLAVVVPVKVGPLDLGTIVSVTKLSLRPGDLAITAQTEPLPTMIAGIPLSIRTLSLNLNRDGFLVNGTSCNANLVDATFQSVDGRTSTNHAPFQLAGCATLPFKPDLEATVSGDPQYPSLKVNVRSQRGQSNLRIVTLALPGALGVNLPAVQGGCMADQFAANACPESAVVGSVKAVSPLLAEPLSGPVRLVQIKGQTLPNLVMDLNGFISLRLTAVNEFIKGKIVARVEGIPDVPISDFEMTLNGGKKGLLTASSKDALCADAPRLLTTAVGQTGAVADGDKTTTKLDCGVVYRRTKSSLKGFGRGHTPRLAINVRGKDLKSMRITLPKQLRLDRKRFKRGAKALAGGKRVARSRVGHTRRTITVSAHKPRSSLALSLSRGALRRGKGLKVGKRITITIRLTDANNKHKTVKLRITPRR